jgi:hypothetical protein
MSDNRNCPFYGRNLVSFGAAPAVGVPAQAILWPTYGNQCALIIGAHSPCYMEIESLPVDWRKCKRVKEIAPEMP